MAYAVVSSTTGGDIDHLIVAGALDLTGADHPLITLNDIHG